MPSYAAVRASDLFVAHQAALRGQPLPLCFEEAGAQNLHGALTVLRPLLQGTQWLGTNCERSTVTPTSVRTRGADLVLRPLVLHGHDEAGRHVGDAHGALRLVDVLPAGARGAVDLDAQVFFPHLHLNLEARRQGAQRARVKWTAYLTLNARSSERTSVAWGRMATVAVDVWTRPLASVTGTRCTRCVPLSCLRRPNTPLPATDAVASWCRPGERGRSDNCG